MYLLRSAERMCMVLLAALAAAVLAAAPAAGTAVSSRGTSDPYENEAPLGAAHGCAMHELAYEFAQHLRPDLLPVLRVFPPCALIPHAQGSSGVVENMPFALRGHTKSLTTRARPSPDLAVWLE